jgi:UDP-N-acetylmuramoyl-L-alanyl-D-glutamate--2,6-diaminopimelate ligase
MKYIVNKLLSIYHFLWSFLGALFYGFPSRKIFVLGVTGTKGKSTTLEIINTILETAEKKTALLSSVRIKIGEQSQKNYLGNTMPGRAFVQKFLRQAVKAGCDHALIEATSQGIVQHRHRFIKWDAALLTNLTPEHIEAHGGFENYRQAKLNFFRYINKSRGQKLFFINKDSFYAEYFEEAVSGGQIILYSKKNLKLKNLNLKSNLMNDFNQENIAAAVAFAESQNIDEEIIGEALKNFPGVPGRMEIIQTEPFRVIIDYAHTPDSLEKVYQMLKSARLICVFGSCGGGRDKWKRPKMGEIASRYCREIILTNEDPYDEEPGQILSEIKSGIFNSQFPISKVFEILDRREAIKKALSLAQKGDTIIITGKGCEPYLHLAKGQKIPWDEREIVLRLLTELNQ